MNNSLKNQPDLIYGVHPIQEALRAKRRKIQRVYTTKPSPKQWASIAAELNNRNIPIAYVTREQLTQRAGTTDHQGIVALVAPFPFRQKPFDSARHKALLILDGIQDPRNLGAILRSAYCTGIDGVIITQRASAPLTAAAFKASAGLAEHLEIMQAPSSAAAAIALQKAGYHLYLATFGGKSITDITFNAPLCIVIGSEGEGISPTIAKQGTAITIPQVSNSISYNASVAAGIFLFTVAHQLKKI